MLMVSNFPDINIYREKICVNTQQKGNFLLPVLIFYMYNIFRKTFFQFDRTRKNFFSFPALTMTQPINLVLSW